MTVRVGIVGAAWGAMAHLPAWRALPGVEVTAICTSREETARAAAQRFGIARPFWDADALCADPNIDIVDLGTRPNWRLPWVLRALENGKHVYNSSPHAPHWEGAKAIDAAWRASGSVAVVDAFIEWVPAVRRQIELVAQGYLGRPIGGTCHFNLSLFNTPFKQFPYNWFAEAEAGVSAMRNNGSHALYPLLEVLGPVEDLVADDRQALGEWAFGDGDTITPQNTDQGNAILRFGNGAVVQLQAGWSMVQHDGWLLDLWGTEGRLVTKSPTFPTAADCKLFGGQRRDKPNPHAPTDLPPIELPESFLAAEGVAIGADTQIAASFPMALSMQRMLGAIAGDAKPSPDCGRALEVERIQEAIRLSHAERRWVAPVEIT